MNSLIRTVRVQAWMSNEDWRQILSVSTRVVFNISVLEPMILKINVIRNKKIAALK